MERRAELRQQEEQFIKELEEALKEIEDLWAKCHEDDEDDED